MKVENRHGGVGGLHLLPAVGDVQRDQMPVGQLGLGLNDRVHDPVLPLQSNASEVRFVTHLEIEVVELVQFADDLASERDLPFQQPWVLQREDFGAGTAADSVDVVRRIHRRRRPEFVVVERAEEIHLDDDSPFLRGPHQIVQPPEVSGIPTSQIEPVSPVVIARLVAPLPGAGVAVRGGCQGVVGNAERAGDFAVGAGKDPRVVQSVRLQRGEIANVVEIQVQQRPVVLARGNQDRRFAAPHEVVPVLRVQRDGRGLIRFRGARERHRDSSDQMDAEQKNTQRATWLHDNTSVDEIRVDVLRRGRLPSCRGSLETDPGTAVPRRESAAAGCRGHLSRQTDLIQMFRKATGPWSPCSIKGPVGFSSL